MPRSVIEGFAVGRPAIISKVIGTDNIIKENINGFCANHIISLSKIIKFCKLPFYKKFTYQKILENLLYILMKKVLDLYWKVIQKINKMINPIKIAVIGRIRWFAFSN